MRNKTSLLIGAALSLGVPIQLLAQEASLEEVVVTARRMDEKLQDVPISITVFQQEQLNNDNISNGSDLAAFTPSLSANQHYGSDNVSFSIRGFAQDLHEAPSVAVYFADAVAPRGGGINLAGGDGTEPGQYFDLQNVQVLKGPQGTLFGRNTDGGAVLIVPNRPTSDFGGYGEVSYGNFGMVRLQGVANVPVSDNLAVRVGIDRQTRDGYARNISGIGPSRFDDEDYTAGRLSILANITPNLENYTVAKFTNVNTNGPMAQVFACNPTLPGAGALFGAAACDQIARNSNNDFYNVQNILPDATYDSRTWQVINTTSWRASDLYTIKNTFSYGQYRDLLRGALFGENFRSPDISFLPPSLSAQSYAFAFTTSVPGINSNDQQTYTEELQIQGRSNDSRLIWQAGGYYERSYDVEPSGNTPGNTIHCSNPGLFQCQNIIGSLLLLADPTSVLASTQIGALTNESGTIAFTNLAAYTQASYSLTNNLKITAGARLNSDTSAGSAQKYALYYDPTLPGALSSANPVSAICTTGTSGEVQPSAARLNNLGACTIAARQSSTRPTETIDLEYKLTTDLLLYAKYTRGYRQGAVNPFGPAGFNSFGPESVNAYETGLKSAFQGAVPGTFDVAGFYNDLTNEQLQIAAVGPGGAAPGVINAGKSRIWGFEVESTVEPFQYVRLDASYTYLNTKLLSATVPTLPPNSVYAYIADTFDVGRALPLTPTNKVSVTASYSRPLPANWGSLAAGVNFTYTSPMATSSVASSGVYYQIDSSSLVSMHLTWSSIAGKPFDASLFATNLLDRDYYTFSSAGYSQLAFQSRTLGEPRMFGVRIRAHFGR